MAKNEKTSRCHQKPSASERSVDDAIAYAEIQKEELPIVVQVWPSDWDRVILADEVVRLRALLTDDEAEEATHA